MALITIAKPRKNFFPSSSLLIAISSSKLAPAQKALSPAERSTMTVACLSCPALSMASAKLCKILPGNELLAG
jgi:hypothetical protein